jgi:hypothetical protein
MSVIPSPKVVHYFGILHSIYFSSIPGSVGTATGQGLDGRGLISDRGKKWSRSQSFQNNSGGPARLLMNGYRGYFLG